MTPHNGIEINVTDAGFITIVAQKDGEKLAFGLEPFDSDRLARELQSATAQAINIRNEEATP